MQIHERWRPHTSPATKQNHGVAGHKQKRKVVTSMPQLAGFGGGDEGSSAKTSESAHLDRVDSVRDGLGSEHESIVWLRATAAAAAAAAGTESPV